MYYFRVAILKFVYDIKSYLLCFSLKRLKSKSVFDNKQQLQKGGSPNLVVMGGDSCSVGRGFESQHLILDGHLFTNICRIKCNVCLEKDENKMKKRPGAVHI